MAKIRIGFQSGREVELKVDEMTVTKDTRTNLVESIRWSGGPHLLFMNLDRIEYVLEER